jgi:phosphorylcholine metabolism protein LicD
MEGIPIDLNVTPKTDMERLLDGIDKEKDNRFKVSWLKLDKGSRLNRIHIFIKKEKIRLELDDSEEKQFKNLVLNLFNSGSLNKSSEIDYCQGDYEIKSIKNLIFNEEKRKFIFSPVQKKKKSEHGGSKSKTNIEKHFNRSKENKESK